MLQQALHAHWPAVTPPRQSHTTAETLRDFYTKFILIQRYHAIFTKHYHPFPFINININIKVKALMHCMHQYNANKTALRCCLEVSSLLSNPAVSYMTKRQPQRKQMHWTNTVVLHSKWQFCASIKNVKNQITFTTGSHRVVNQ